MATVNKNFKIKSGLVVEGTTGTINGYNILTEAQDSIDFIVSTIGGTATSSNTPNAVVKRDGSGNFVAGTITADLVGNADTASELETSRTIELTGDVTGSVSFDGSSNVQISTTLNASYATDSEVATAKSEAISAASSDATSKADAAEASANSYTDDEVSSLDLSLKAYADQAEADAITTAALDATSKANAAKTAAEATASADATSKANAAQTAAEATASADATSKANAAQTAAEATASADATSKANAAQTAAELTASNANSTLYTTVTGDIATAKAEANSYTDDKVSDLVGLAPAALDTLEELATALENNPDIIADLQDIAAGKQNTLTAGYGIDITAETISVAFDAGNGLAINGTNLTVDTNVISTKAYAEGVADDAQSAAEATAALDATSKANAAQTAAEATASADATSKANAAESAAIAAADFTALGYAQTAESNAAIYTSAQITQEVADRNSAISGAIDTEVTNRNTAISAAVTQEVADRNSAISTEINALDTDDIEEGASNLYFTNARAISAVGGTIGDAINLLDTDDIEEGSTNLYFTNSRAVSATAASYDVLGAAAAADTSARGYADSLAVNYDAAGSANTAYSDAVAASALDATSKANAAQTAAEATASNALTTAVNNLEDYADTAEQDAKDYADALINDASNSSAEVWSAYKTSTEIGLAQAAAEQHADDAVAALVGSAPSLLDTLQELAAALDNDPEAINSLQSIAAGKQDALTAGSNINITGATISVTGLDSADISDFNAAAVSATAASYDAAGSASTAQSAAEATAQAALDDVLDGTTAFTEINVNSEAKHFAATSSSLGSVVVTAYEWAKADYRSAKIMVKIDNGTHNEMSELLITLDSTDNIAITEYAIIGTNGSRGTVTADISGSMVRVRVNPVNDSTIKVTGTLLK